MLHTYPKVEILARNRTIAKHILKQVTSHTEASALIAVPPESFVSPKAVFDAIDTE